MDLGWTRGQIACRLGVRDTALRNWEAGATRPGPKHLPRIEHFLGAKPIEPDDPLGQRLRAWREVHGISKARAGRLSGLHEQTIAHLERGGRRWVTSSARTAIERLLAGP